MIIITNKKYCILLAFIAVMLTGCSSGASSSLISEESTGLAVNTESATVGTNKKETIVLNYATSKMMSPAEKELINEFNAADNDYRINVITYSDTGDDELVVQSESEIKNRKIEILNDIASGDIDIIADAAFGGDLFENLMGKGAFADLYQFMGNDPEINTSTLNSHILELHETDGSLYMLPYLFSVNTLYGESKYVGTKENQTIDEFIDNWNAMPHGSMICGSETKDYVYMEILRPQMFRFIDMVDGEVHFDSPEFIKMLEFCNSFYNIDGEYHEPAWNAVNMVKKEKLCGFDAFHLCVRSGDVTFVGYPSEEGAGSYVDSIGHRLAISDEVSEERQKGAWEYLKMAAGEEYQLKVWNNTDEKSLLYGECGFPINLNAYNKAAEGSLKGEYTSDVRSLSGVEENVGHLTEDELKRCTAFINNTKSIASEIDRAILVDVINSEVYPYFRGEQSAEKTAEMLQNRLSLYVSELQ